MKSFQEFTLYIFHQEISSRNHTVVQCIYDFSFVSSYKMHSDGSKRRFAFFQEIEIISFRSIYRDKSGIISTGSLPTKYVISLREPRKLFLFRGIYPPIISWRILSKREPFVLSNHFIDWFFSKTSPSLRKLPIPLSLSLYTFIPSLFNLSTVSYA